MKFINYLETIAGVDIYGLVALIIFMVMFTVIIIWTIKADKQMIDEISQIPLDNNHPIHS